MILNEEPPCACSAAVQPVAAGAGVNQLAMAFPCLPGCGQRPRNVLARAGARVGQSAGDQSVQRILIQGASLRLVNRGLVWHQTALRQLFKDDAVCTWHAARAVYIFDAHQPLALMRPGVQPAGQGGYQRARVQRTCG